jgi:hypothetical protein
MNVSVANLMPQATVATVGGRFKQFERIKIDKRLFSSLCGSL